MLGGHQDAWTYGANDDLSGWSSVLEVGKRLGALMRQGWRPDRTIVLAGWDGEEYGLLGSTEWTEQYERVLHAKAVAYLNVDITAGQEFGAGAAPALDKLLFDVTKTVPEPGAGRRSTTSGAAQGGAHDRPPGQRLGLHRPVRPRRRPLAGGGLHEPERRVPLRLRRHLPARALPRSRLRARGRRGEDPRRHRAAPRQRRRLPAALLRLRDRGAGLRRRPAEGRAAAGRRAGRPDAAARGGAGLGRGDERPRGARGAAAAPATATAAATVR